MTAWTRPSPATALDELRRLASVARAIVDDRPVGRGPDAGSAGRLRATLETSLDVLLVVVVDDELGEDTSRRMIAVRDAVASHLRAADEIAAADARPVVAMRLLVRATAVLSEAIDQVSVTSR